MPVGVVKHGKNDAIPRHYAGTTQQSQKLNTCLNAQTSCMTIFTISNDRNIEQKRKKF